MPLKVSVRKLPLVGSLGLHLLVAMVLYPDLFAAGQRNPSYGQPVKITLVANAPVPPPAQRVPEAPLEEMAHRLTTSEAPVRPTSKPPQQGDLDNLLGLSHPSKSANTRAASGTQTADPWARASYSNALDSDVARIIADQVRRCLSEEMPAQARLLVSIGEGGQLRAAPTVVRTAGRPSFAQRRAEAIATRAALKCAPFILGSAAPSHPIEIDLGQPG